jgi:DUF1009 family protein
MQLAECTTTGPLSAAPQLQTGRQNDEPKFGLLAGWGRYPIVVAEQLRNQGYRVCCAGIKGHADPRLAEICTDFEWFGVARLGAIIRYYRRHDVQQVTMAGKIHKHRLIERWAWFRHLPDFRTWKRFAQHFLTAKQDRKDDTLLMAVVEEFAQDNITFVPATDYVPELLVKYGQLTRRAPTALERKDIEFGWTLAKEMGRLDIGQSVAIRGLATLAVEAIEGTDKCIERAGQLCKAAGFTIVKVAKPQQDMRFDVPTIGRGTLETMFAAGASCLAIEAGRTILLDQAEVIDFADRHRLAIVALTADGTVPELLPKFGEPFTADAARP